MREKRECKIFLYSDAQILRIRDAAHCFHIRNRQSFSSGKFCIPGNFIKTRSAPAMLCIAETAACRSFNPAPDQRNNLVAAGAIPDFPCNLHRGTFIPEKSQGRTWKAEKREEGGLRFQKKNSFSSINSGARGSGMKTRIASGCCVRNQVFWRRANCHVAVAIRSCSSPRPNFPFRKSPI